MVDEVQREIERIQEYISTGRLVSCDETSTKATAIEPILRELGWDVADLDEVRREYPVRARPNARPVDYLLFCDDAPKVIVEAKRGNQSLERHQEQLQDYVGFALAERVEIAILTNGAAWWYYLPLRDASWERRRVATVEFNQPDSRKIAQTLVDLLGKENVRSGKAIQNAEELYREYQISETFPEAWNQLLSEPDSLIVEFLVEKTRELCGHEPDRDSVKLFLSEHVHQIDLSQSPTTPERGPSSEPTAVPTSASPRHPRVRSGSTSCTAFTFRGNRYEVSSWGDMIVKLCEMVHSARGDRFEEVLSLSRTYSRNPNEIKSGQSRQISGTNIFVDVHGGRVIEGRARTLITYFGYNESELSFETRTL